MPSPVLRDFQADDIKKIMNRDGMQGEQAVIVQQANLGPAFTAEVDGVPIGCGGVAILWAGVGFCWLVLSDDIGNHGVWLTHVTKEFIDATIEAFSLHRLEAVVLEDSLRNRAWVELLGFTKERDGIAVAYLPDRRSMVRYELVR